jgi:hypothetical protein
MSPVVWPIDLAILFANAIRAKLNAKDARYLRKATATFATRHLLPSGTHGRGNTGCGFIS